MPRPLQSEHDCDVLVVGGGAAGLSAALVLARACRRVAVFDSGKPRNSVSNRMGGFLTRDGSHPSELRRLGREQLAAYPAVRFMAETEVIAASANDRGFRVTTAAGATLSGRKVLIATGVEDHLPPLYDIEEFYGRSVWHCPYCDGYEHRGQSVAVYGQGAPALSMAKELTGWTDRITLVSDGPCGLSPARRARLSRLNIAIREERIARLEGEEGQLARIAFAAGPELEASAMFFRSDGKANSSLAAQLGVTSADAPFIRTAGYGKTHVPGVYVAGDMSRHVQLAIVAAGEGAAAAFAINSELLKEDLA